MFTAILKYEHIWANQNILGCSKTCKIGHDILQNGQIGIWVQIGSFIG